VSRPDTIGVDEGETFASPAEAGDIPAATAVDAWNRLLPRMTTRPRRAARTEATVGAVEAGHRAKHG